MDIQDAADYERHIRRQDLWDQPQAAAVLDYWLRAVEAFANADCGPKVLEDRCGSLGAVEAGGDWLCWWIDRQGRDSQTLWDLCLAVTYQLDGDGPGSKAILRAIDRATPVIRWLVNPVNSDQPEPQEPQTNYTPREAAGLLDVQSTATVRKYANFAGVEVPSGRGRTNHRYSEADIANICRIAIEKSDDSKWVEHCKALLTKIEIKSNNRNQIA